MDRHSVSVRGGEGRAGWSRIDEGERWKGREGGRKEEGGGFTKLQVRSPIEWSEWACPRSNVLSSFTNSSVMVCCAQHLCIVCAGAVVELKCVVTF